MFAASEQVFLGWTWHADFRDKFACVCPCEAGAHDGTMSFLAQGSGSMLSHGRAGRGQGAGSPPAVGTGVRGQGHAEAPRPGEMHWKAASCSASARNLGIKITSIFQVGNTSQTVPGGRQRGQMLSCLQLPPAQVHRATGTVLASSSLDI